MNQRHHGAHRELELETEGDVQHHQPQGQQHGQTALFPQFVPDLGTDEFDPPQLDGAVKGRLQLLQQLRTLLVGVAMGQADQYVPVGAKTHHCGALVALGRQGVADTGEIGGLAVVNLQQGAAGKIQAPVQLLHEERHKGGEHQGDGERGRDFAQAHKVDHLHTLMPPMDSFFTRRPP